MAGVDPGEGTSQRPDYAVMRKQGDRGTPFDLKEILLRMVSNICDVNLERFSMLDHRDDLAAYEAMAVHAAQPEVHTVHGFEDYYAVDDNNMDYFVVQYIHDDNFLKFSTCIYQYVSNDIVKRMMLRRGVEAIKRIYRLTKVTSEKLMMRCHVNNEEREELCQTLVEAIFKACEDFEVSSNRQLMSSYVNIWEIDNTAMGGFQNLTPMRTYTEPVPDVPAEGTELIKFLIERLLKIRISESYLPAEKAPILVVLKTLVWTIVEQDSRTNPLTANDDIVDDLIKHFDKAATELSKATSSAVTENYILYLFAFDVQKIIQERCLTKLEHEYEALKAFFIIIGRFVKRICESGSPSAKSVQIHKAICEAVREALKNCEDELVKKFERNVWLNFESHYGHILSATAHYHEID